MFRLLFLLTATLHAAEPLIVLREEPVRVATASGADIFPEA